jgi:hypothetical protein
LAPGAIYTAGVNTALLADPQWTKVANLLTANNPTGFYEPQLLLAVAGKAPVFGPPNAAAFPEMGGDITITAQQDVIGFQDVKNLGQSLTLPFAQLYSPWLMSTAQIGASGESDFLKLGAGVFTPTVSLAGVSLMTQQSAWWIQFGSFAQGVMSVGGNVTLTAGRDVRDFSVSLPTTGRVSGGLSQRVNGQINTPVPHVYGSGNMNVSVGRTLASGSFYEGSGHASILVRGSVVADWQTTTATSAGVVVSPAGTVLALDSGQIALTAGGSISLGTSLYVPGSTTAATSGGIVNPAALRKQPRLNGGGAGTASFVLQTYGPDSKVRLSAGSGDIALGTFNPKATASPIATPYPASLDAVAFAGSINLYDNAVFFDALEGSLDLLAMRDIALINSGLSTGASLIDTAFNAYTPNNGFASGTSKVLLAQAGREGVNHVYAVTGSITTSTVNTNGVGLRFSSNRPVAVQAAIDIIDLNLIAQNVNVGDVSRVSAGRDIRYTGLNNFGGLQIAGPGFFHVEAGRDLGPFLPLAKNTVANAKNPEGIQSVGNSGIVLFQGNLIDPITLGQGAAVFAQFPVGNGPDVQVFAPPNAQFVGPRVGNRPGFAGTRNFLLPDTGASIVAMFGVAKGVNYQGVIDAYVDPDSAIDVPHSYVQELRAFLARLGMQTVDRADAWSQFNGLSRELQQIFAGQVFFAELKATGIPDGPSYKQFQRGYTAVNIMFPADVSAGGLYGYTRNDLSGGSNGANSLVETGNLDMLHATIQTQRGGDISIFGPGGQILVGSVALEPNSNLKLNHLGILTLAGGSINSFSDQDVLVNGSRVMTWYGGDILMWSSNRDLDAGRGAKTTLSFPPLKVNFNPDNIQTVDLGGLVSGAGIAVLQTEAFADKSDAYLLAPRGTVDAGDAGVRVSGNLSVLAVSVLNGDNFSVGGNVTGVPSMAAADIGGLTDASNSAGAAAAQSGAPKQQANDQPSIIIVEVLGFGGEDGEDDGSPRPAKRKPAGDRAAYNPDSNVRVLGYSSLGDEQMSGLTEEEKKAIRN